MSKMIQGAAVMLSLAVPLFANAAEAMTVVRDRETGELRAPNALEIQALKAAEAQIAKGSGLKPTARGPAAEVRHPDGSVSMMLDESTAMYSVATRNADGSVNLQCLPADQAAKVVKSPVRASMINKSTAKAGYELK